MKSKFWHIFFAAIGIFFSGLPIMAMQEEKIGSKPSEKPRTERIPIRDSKTKFKTSLSLTLPPFRVMILDDKGPAALLGLEVILEATTLEQAMLVHPWWIKIQSAVFEDLYGVAPFLWDTGYTPTVKSLQKRLLRVCRGILGPDVLRNVRVQKAYLRPLRAKNIKNA